MFSIKIYIKQKFFFQSSSFFSHLCLFILCNTGMANITYGLFMYTIFRISTTAMQKKKIFCCPWHFLTAKSSIDLILIPAKMVINYVDDCQLLLSIKPFTDKIYAMQKKHYCYCYNTTLRTYTYKRGSIGGMVTTFSQRKIQSIYKHNFFF